jgi:gamma-glutamyltranspeptidase / glutathione hydrolase
MAATAQPLASEIAIDVLKQGGSAVDAAIAANAALGLMEPISCGVGGDLFAVIWDAKSQRLYGINGGGRSPMGLSYELNVQGTVDAWFELHQKFGKLPISQDLAPAIKYAEEGFPVSELIAYYWGPERCHPGAAAGRDSSNLHRRWKASGQRRDISKS